MPMSMALELVSTMQRPHTDSNLSSSSPIDFFKQYFLSRSSSMTVHLCRASNDRERNMSDRNFVLAFLYRAKTSLKQGEHSSSVE